MDNRKWMTNIERKQQLKQANKQKNLHEFLAKSGHKTCKENNKMEAINKVKVLGMLTKLH